MEKTVKTILLLYINDIGKITPEIEEMIGEYPHFVDGITNQDENMWKKINWKIRKTLITKYEDCHSVYAAGISSKYIIENIDFYIDRTGDTTIFEDLLDNYDPHKNISPYSSKHMTLEVYDAYRVKKRASSKIVSLDPKVDRHAFNFVIKYFPYGGIEENQWSFYLENECLSIDIIKHWGFKITPEVCKYEYNGRSIKDVIPPIEACIELLNYVEVNTIDEVNFIFEYFELYYMENIAFRIIKDLDLSDEYSKSKELIIGHVLTLLLETPYQSIIDLLRVGTKKYRDLDKYIENIEGSRKKSARS